MERTSHFIYLLLLVSVFTGGLAAPASSADEEIVTEIPLGAVGPGGESMEALTEEPINPSTDYPEDFFAGLIPKDGAIATRVGEETAPQVLGSASASSITHDELPDRAGEAYKWIEAIYTEDGAIYKKID